MMLGTCHEHAGMPVFQSVSRSAAAASSAADLHLHLYAARCYALIDPPIINFTSFTYAPLVILMTVVVVVVAVAAADNNNDECI